jgi:acetylornithine deacetylase
MTSHSRDRLARTRDILAALVGFDTTSRDSNLPLVEWVEDFLRPLGADLKRLSDPTGTKANLWARIGPDAPGGIVLSGHTDVVPVDGQPWTTNPFALTEYAGRLHGRGTCDMKGFLALALAHAEDFAEAKLSHPIHFALSFDEEVGCAGVAPMIDRMVQLGAAPRFVWVGEPTLWGVVSAHKGIRDYEVTITGKECHSSDPRRGASAIHEAIELMSVVRRIAVEAEQLADPASGFDPSYPTITVGVVHGGTASNIIARRCVFEFDIRATPGVDTDALLAPFLAAVEVSRARLAAVDPSCGVEIAILADAPPLRPEAGGEADRFLRDLTGDNATRVVPYAAEAGQFQRAGFSTAICGPGSIDQAHQPNEYVAISELEKGVEIFGRLLQRLKSQPGSAAAAID